MLHLVQTHLYTLLIYNELFCTNHIRIYLSTLIIGINCPLPVSPEGTYGLRSVCLSVCESVCPSHFTGSCDTFLIFFHET